MRNEREADTMVKYAEFCSGVGGFRLGIQATTHDSECVYKNEIDSKCEDTYYKNFNEKFDSKDIFEINVEDIPDIDVLCSGFPCQPFSIAGKQKGLQDDRGKIILKLIEIIDKKRPHVIFLENVANLQRHENGKTLKLIEKSFNKMGYSVYTKILDSAKFGVPQSRPRLYIVAFNSTTLGKVEFRFPDGGKQIFKTVRDILVPGDFSIPISEKWKEYIDLYTGIKTENEMSFQVPKTRKRIERVSENCDINDCVLQIRSSGIRAYSLDGQFPTFAVSNSGGGAMIPVLTKEKRHLSVLEMKRIMGFPDGFLFPVSRTDSIKQLANAVCPPVISAIYDEIVKTIEFSA